MNAVLMRRRIILILSICSGIYFLIPWYMLSSRKSGSNISQVIFKDSLYIREFKGSVTRIVGLPRLYKIKDIIDYAKGDTNPTTFINKLDNLFNEKITTDETKSDRISFAGQKVRITKEFETIKTLPHDIEKDFNEYPDNLMQWPDYKFSKIRTHNFNPDLDVNLGSKSLEKRENMKLVTSDLQSQSTKDAISHTFLPNPDLGGNPGSKPRNMYKITPTAKPRRILPVKRPDLIIDTSGCKISKFDPWDQSVIKFITIYGPYKCSDFPPFMTSEPHGIIHLNVTVLKKYYKSSLDSIDCWYQGIIRKHEEHGNIRENDYYRTDVRRLKFNVPIDEDYVVVKCFFSGNRTHEQFFPLVKLKDDFKKEASNTDRPLNVILLGIDSVSSLNFMRHFNRTKTFLDKIKPFTMNGYAKVGDNTFPNLVPMLTGHFVEDYWNETIKDTFYFDNVSFIWKDYSGQGYKTFLAEDMPYSGTFNYLKRGFYDPPTDYYYRPMALAIENSEAAKKARDVLSPCINSQLETDIMYDYLKNFVRTMGKNPFFAFCMVSVLTHDELNNAIFADEPAKRILKELDDFGAFDTSLVVLFSDHGIRFGDIRETYIGKFEERLPFMHIHVPQWFLSKFPKIKNNLIINQDRLITLFDLHATMKHILHLNGNLVQKTDELGLSLFHEIPENRTCSDANIKPHYCPCNNYIDVSLNDSTVQKLSESLVDHINELLLPHSDVCAKLKVSSIKDARVGLLSENSKNERNKNLPMVTTVKNYLITVKVKPSLALFEATIQYDIENNKTTVLGISRLTMYGKQSWCIDSQILRLYCYCYDQKW